MPNLKFIDLFCGIGGMRIAFEKAGCECVFSSDNDKFCQKTYSANFVDIPFGDIRNIRADSIPDFDILVGGFPCQPFSIAGISKKNSLGQPTGFEDKTQGTMFFEACRVLQSKYPRAFLLENVKNLISHDKGRTFQIIMESLEALGYNVFWKVIDAKHYVPQHRERIFIVGFRDYSIDFNFDFVPEECPMKLKDILQDEVDNKYTLTDKMWECLKRHKSHQVESGYGFGYGIADPEGITRTLLARYYKDGSEILIEQEGKNPRKLTPRECARLQGFPDTFVIPVSDTQAYKQFGNTVAVPLVTAIAKEIVKKLQ